MIWYLIKGTQYGIFTSGGIIVSVKEIRDLVNPVCGKD